MALSANGAKLVGSDGTLFTAVIGTEIVGDNITPLAAGYYVVTAIAGSSNFPASAGTGAIDIRVGDLIKVGTTALTPNTGDNVKPLTLTERCDVQSWTLNFTADEIETTTFCDLVKTYEVGKTDSSGTITGITSIGTTTGPDGFLRQFTDTIEQDDQTQYDVYAKNTSLIFALLTANKEGSAKGDEIDYFAPINIFSSDIGGDQASAQTFTTTFRIGTATDTTVNPALYRFAVPV